MECPRSAHCQTCHMTDAAPLRLIRSLLAKAEATEYPAEADAFLAKVADLVARHSIDEAMLWAETGVEARSLPVERFIVVDAPYAGRKSMLVHGVAAANRCEAIDVGETGLARVSVIGFEGDVIRVEVLVTSLLMQMTTAMIPAERTRSQGDATATAAFRRSFITAYAWRVGDRLSAAADSGGNEAPVPKSATPVVSTDLVLIERAEVVAEAVKTRYPRLRTHHIDGGSSHEGTEAGTSAGNRAELAGTSLGTSQGELAR